MCISKWGLELPLLFISRNQGRMAPQSEGSVRQGKGKTRWAVREAALEMGKGESHEEPWFYADRTDDRGGYHRDYRGDRHS